MNKIRMQRILSLLLVVVVIFSNGSLTALAAGGAHANTGSGGIDTPEWGGDATGRQETVLHIAGGGYKLSIVSVGMEKYEPTDKKGTPTYGEDGVTAISVNGGTLMENNTKGKYGVAPMYLVGGWNDKNEFGINNNLTYGFQEDAISGKLMTESNLEKAANKANIEDKDIWKNIYKAFNQTDILRGTTDINTYLKMTDVKSADANEKSSQHNSDILNTLLNLAISMYGGSKSAMGAYLTKIQAGNMTDNEVIILIEPMAHINIKSLGSGYITPANFIFGSSNITPQKYVNYNSFAEMMSHYNPNSNYGMWSGAGTYIVGVKNDDLEYTGAISSALGGHNPTSNQSQYRESLFSKVVYTGPFKWEGTGFKKANANNYKWGYGCLASSDFLESTPTSKIKEASVSVSMLGQSSGFTPSISMGITTQSSVDDTDLDTQVSTAITELDKFASERGMTIETLNDYLSSDACIEILKIVIQDYTKAYTEKTSLSDKEETIDGKISAILEESKLGLDSIYIAKYMNLLMKNGTTDEETGQFTFNSDANKALIKYLYTMFDDGVADNYNILSNIEIALSGKDSDISPKFIQTAVSSVDSNRGDSESSEAYKGTIQIFGGITANIVSDVTSTGFIGEKALDNLTSDKPLNDSTEAGVVITQSDIDREVLEITNELAVDAGELFGIYYDYKTLQSRFEASTGFFDTEVPGDLDSFEEYERLFGQNTLALRSWAEVQKVDREIDATRKPFQNISIASIYPTGKSNKSYLKYGKDVNKLLEQYVGIELSGDSFYLVEGIDKDTVVVYNKFKSILEELDKKYNIKKEITQFYKDNNIDESKNNWSDTLNYTYVVIGKTLNAAAAYSKKPIVITYDTALSKEVTLNEYEKLTITTAEPSADDESEAENLIADRIFRSNTVEVSEKMDNSLASLKTSLAISIFGEAILNIPYLNKESSNKETEVATQPTDIGTGISTQSDNIDTTVMKYYSPIVSVESEVMSNGYYGLMVTKDYLDKGYMSVNTDKMSEEAIADLNDEDGQVEMDLKDLAELNLNYPNGSFTSMSDEIQTLLSDYTNDCIEYTKWYWSDKNNDKSKSTKSLNEKFDNELQYRVGMYLDILKDTREDVTYRNAITNKEVVDGTIAQQDQDQYYDYIWGNGGSEVGNYYDRLGSAYDMVEDRLSGIESLNTESTRSLVEYLGETQTANLYYDGIFGSVIPYLSTKTYKFNKVKNSNADSELDYYIGGSFQYPLSYVTCNVSEEQFGQELKVNDTYRYSVYSINNDTSENTNYFDRTWPVTLNGENLGASSGVYDVSKALVEILKAYKAGGGSIYKTDNKNRESYVLVDGTGDGESSGRLVPLPETAVSILGLSSKELRLDYEKNSGAKATSTGHTTLESLIHYLENNNNEYKGGIVADYYMSEELIAFTQYLFESIVTDTVLDAKLKNEMQNDMHSLLNGNGGFEHTVDSILNATTTAIGLSWWEGIAEKIGASSNAITQRQRTGGAGNSADDIDRSQDKLKEYRTVLASLLYNLGFNIDSSTILKDFVNKDSLVDYSTDGISYGSSTSGETSGITVNNEVFNYYVENMIAMASLTKNQTAVYVADDGEVSDTSIYTAIGGAVAKLEYLENQYNTIEKPIAALEYEASSIVKTPEYKKLEEAKKALKVKLDAMKVKIDAISNESSKKAVEDYKKASDKYETAYSAYIKAKANYESAERLYNEAKKKYDSAHNRQLSVDKEYKENKAALGIWKSKIKQMWVKESNTVKALGNPVVQLDVLEAYARTFGMLKNLGRDDRVAISAGKYKDTIDTIKKYDNINSKVTSLKAELNDIDSTLKVYNWSKVKELKNNATKLNKTLKNAESAKDKASNTKEALRDKSATLSKYLDEYDEYNKEYRKYDELLSINGDLLADVKALDDKKTKLSKILDELSNDGKSHKYLKGTYAEYIEEVSQKPGVNIDINNYGENGNYMFNLTSWEYEDSDSGAVVYLPGNSNAILNAASVKNAKESSIDNIDNRVSNESYLKAFGYTAENISKSMDAIASLQLQSSASKSENLNIYNFMYSNGSWPAQAVINNDKAKITANSLIFDQDIPIDAQIIEVDNNGKVLKYNDLIKNFDSIPSNVVSTLDIAESFKIAGITVEVKYMALSPAVDNGGVYELPKGIGKNIMDALQNKDVGSTDILKGLKVVDTASYLQPLEDLSYEYSTSSGTEKITGKYMAALTEYDRQMYAKDSNAHPILVLLVTVKEPIRQINLIENTDGDVAVEEVEPSINKEETEVYLKDTVNVKDSTGTGVAELDNWVVVDTDDLPKDLQTEAVDETKVLTNGSVSTVKPVEGGQTVIVTYLEKDVTALNGDITLQQDEITKQYAFSDYIDASNLVIRNKIRAASPKGWYVPGSHNQSCADDCTSSHSDWVPSKMTSNDGYKYVFDLVDGLDPLIVPLVNGIFKPGFIGDTNITKDTVGLNGKNVPISPNYEFVIWRYMDVPTLASFKKNDKALTSELGLKDGTVPTDRIINTGTKETEDTLDIAVGADTGADGYDADTEYTTKHGTAKQSHDVKTNVERNAKAIIKTYTGNLSDVADVKSKNSGVLNYSINGVNFSSAMGYTIPNKTNISFYPYVKMTYEGIDGNAKDAYVLATNLSELNVSDYVDMGFTKDASISLILESKQWSSHARSKKFLETNGIGDRNSVLPGGATYSLNDGNVYVGYRTWQTVLSDTAAIVQTGGSYYSEANAKSRATKLNDEVVKSLESYDVIQYIAKGILTKPNEIISSGTSLNKIASGTSQKVYGNQLSKADKYYLKTKTALSSIEPDEADIDIINNDEVRQITYTIKSDVDGKVTVEKNGVALASIAKTEGLSSLLNNAEIAELDEKTKLITNYMSVIDRNKGKDKADKSWYNEAWDGISVVMTERILKVGFNKTSSRSSVLDPMLIGTIDNKADIYNFKDTNKVRTSIFRLSDTISTGGHSAGWVATWGESNVDIRIKNIENMFVSKPFYVPNASVMDLN